MDINQIKLDNKFKLVEASAGTGKSFTLAHLVLRNVLEKKIIEKNFSSKSLKSSTHIGLYSSHRAAAVHTQYKGTNTTTLHLPR